MIQWNQAKLDAERRVDSLKIGQLFEFYNPYKSRFGKLIDKYSGSCLVEWMNQKKEISRVDRKTGEKVSYEVNSSKRETIATESRVIPIDKIEEVNPVGVMCEIKPRKRGRPKGSKNRK